ncbi:MAG: hypothetical protein LQ340_007946, partial [Diploschistes diacapsis]
EEGIGRERKGKGRGTGTKEEEADEMNVYDGDMDEYDGIDVDFIDDVDLVNDEEMAAGMSRPSGSSRNDGFAGWGLNPVRLRREEHIKRAAGVNTDASSATSAQIRQKAKEAGVDASEVTVVADEGSAAPKIKAVKSKGKARDVEFVRDEKKWQGVFTDEDVVEPKIKQEDADDVHMADVPSITATGQTAVSPPSTPPIDKEMPPPPVPQKEAKPKRRRQSWQHFNKPVLQTQEDYAEWERYKEDMANLAEELSISKIEPIKDADGGTDITEADPVDRRQDLVYLFQLPPILPNLVTPSQATQLDESKTQDPTGYDGQPGANIQPDGIRSAGNPQQLGKANASRPDTSQTKIKQEEDTKDPNLTNVSGPRLDISAATEEDFVGPVGTLTVYESGVTALDWGGVEFELGIGVGSHLQEVVILDDGEVKGEANAMSEVSANFVVTPGWESLFAAKK